MSSRGGADLMGVRLVVCCGTIEGRGDGGGRVNKKAFVALIYTAQHLVE